MNYRHIFHAGGFSDVFKHTLLIGLIQSLAKKATPLCYLETHAGTGFYDLSSTEGQKNQEAYQGILKILAEKTTPPLVKDYLSYVKKANPAKFRFYPGSPYFAQLALRPHDRMILCELQRDVANDLRKFFKHDPQVMIHAQDGYQSLKALLPPKERRGLILIDPAYEKITEFTTVLESLKTALQRFATGTYAIWYPIKLRSSVNAFHRDVQSQIAQTVLIAELNLFADDIPNYLNGCGMLIVNPPWQFDTVLQETLPWLLEKLNVHQGSYLVKFLA